MKNIGCSTYTRTYALPRIQLFDAHAETSYRARLKGGPQVAWMLQAKPDRSGKQQHKQNSPNLVIAF